MAGARSGGRILVDNLVAQGCDRIFTVPGESFLAVLDALHDTPAIDLVVCRQEGGAGFMACADGSLTGRPGIVFATRGPGATNASIAVHVAMQDSIPLILFIGDVARSDRDREAFQEVDFAAAFTPLAKWAARIDDAHRVPEYVARAYAVAMSGRPGPIVLALPEDMLTDVAQAHDRPRVTRPAQFPDPGAMEALMAMLDDAEQPVAIVGGADWDASAADHFRRFAERIGLPVAAAFRRQDAINNRSPVYAGNLGYGPNPKLLERVRDADLLLVVGARLGEATTDGYTLITPDHPGQRLIHVHPDPQELGRVFHPDLAICADCSEFAEAAEAWEDEVVPFEHGAQAHADWQAWNTPAPSVAALDLAACVAHMRATVGGPDTILCNGAGNFSGWWHRYWSYEATGSQLAPTAGAMGYGLPAAITASLRRPEARVIALAGDGDFLMNGQELATAVQHDCDIIVIVVDNGSYGTIRMHQERRHPGRVSGTTLANPDFAALARAYGAQAATVVATDEFGPAFDHLLAQRGVRLLHLKTDVEQIAPGITVAALRGL
ncbi:acetolactate synthase-1/2/3 large subunit [Sphingomonas jejuensis]|uniref:Acetolactate synthase-1/2/3 large subunit n=1 Tax=Sphingomonas jejuensis TaxID=904715 RepID=A0ABX0XLY8_9SPHN|nr:thiamine pyrophosphate-binding protein [Sphingomonas jejuensis]NJC33819.1 acetolactate synthase-1/2/3 large subunit [Sphingomonas jejuensis]